MDGSCSTGLDATYEEILFETMESVRKEGDSDTFLLDILSRHIINLSPSKGAVEEALQKIVALAELRGRKNE